MARTVRSILLALFCWAVILTAIGAVLRYQVLPKYRAQRQRQVTEQTGTVPQAQATVRLALDGFSGYCLLRSADLAARLAAQGVALAVTDDQADYMARLKGLRDGACDLAVFPVNSFLQCGARLGAFPGSIVYVVDETVGADAVVARSAALPNLGALNAPNARIVATPDSPSEFLARIVLASFSLPALPAQGWLVETRGSADAFKRLQADVTGEPRAYVLWEPDVSRALADRRNHVLVDSANVKGYIVDVLVARREFLVEHAAVTRLFLEEYARTVFAARDRMAKAILADARALGVALNETESERVAAGIQWKNTLENYAHFGLGRPGEQARIETLPAILLKVVEVLVRTGALAASPLADHPVETLYHDRIVRGMRESQFHPGQGLAVLDGVAGAAPDEKVRGEAGTPALTGTQWAALVTVGELAVEPVQFLRGSSRIGIQGERALAALADTLSSWPRYYLSVTGRVRPGGDEAAALELARTRAETVADFLAAKGIARERLRTAAEVSRADTAEAQSVAFVVKQMPY